jgi:autoinducer 2-degrading protein
MSGGKTSRRSPNITAGSSGSFRVTFVEFESKHILMTVTLVHVFVKPEFVDQFIEVTRVNHESSIRESGNFRFDILQELQDKTKFILYEAYESQQAADAHKATAHYAEWRDTVAPWMAQSRNGIKHTLLFPEKST